MSIRKVLVVEDEPIMRVTLAHDLGEEGYEVTLAEDGEEGLKLVHEDNFDIAILDIRLPKVGGIDLLKAIKEKSPGTLVIMITAYGSVETAVEAMKAGAYDYITKPFSMDELLLLLRRTGEHLDLQRETSYLRQKLEDRYSFGNIIYASKAMMEICDLVKTIADSEITILIQGETGTGKELIANAIHYNSPRRNGPLVKVNCAALPETLLETELFGHEKGAFTGAYKQRLGRFELAHKGTLFLDEIGEISPAVQIRLLRVLQEKEFERVGGTKTIRVDVRVICANKEKLGVEVSRGRIRQDLFYRLKVVSIDIPPLRERREDIVPLADHFLHKYAQRAGKKVSGFEPNVYRIFMEYDWPGNVRELENIVQVAVTLSKKGKVSLEELPPELRYMALPSMSGEKKRTLALNEALRQAERDHLLRVLQAVGGQKSKAAQLLGISRKSLWKKIKSLKINPPLKM